MPNDKLKKFLEVDILKERIGNFEKAILKSSLRISKKWDGFEQKLKENIPLKKEESEIFESELLRYIEEQIPEYFDEIRSKLPSLCIYKNKIDPTPCVHYTLRVLDISIKDRLEYQNSKISRRYTTLGVLITIIFSILALSISIFALFK